MKAEGFTSRWAYREVDQAGLAGAGGLSRAKRWLLASAGLLSLAVGIAGIFLPLLPTTPLLLLAAACFMRSSRTLYRWLMSHKRLGPYIYQFRVTRAVPLRNKIATIALVWAGILLSVMVLDSPWLRAMLLIIATGVTIHLSRMASLQPHQVQEARAKYQAFLLREFGDTAEPSPVFQPDIEKAD